MRTKHRGLIESMITSKVEVVKKCEDFPFGAQYIIFQFQAYVHPNWDKWDLLDEGLRTNLEFSTLSTFNILAHISGAQASLACSFTMDVIKAWLKGLQSGRRRTCTMLPNLFTRSCWQQLKRKNLAGMHICFAIFV
jgi:hypothetical protein